MARAKKVCPTSGCGALTSGGRCRTCRDQADRARGTATERGYKSRGHTRFRRAVLRRDPVCVLCDLRIATVADHWPISRRELVAAGLNPNDPARGRGLCKDCHDRETAKHQPGGWAARGGG